MKQQKVTKKLPVVYFGASTGAAYVLRAAAFSTKNIKAIVLRGGRPDMAVQELHKIISPTLFFVGGLNDVVLELNEKAYHKLRCERKLEIIPEATHLFEEPVKLKEVADLSTNWFATYLLPEK